MALHIYKGVYVTVANLFKFHNIFLFELVPETSFFKVSSAGYGIPLYAHSFESEFINIIYSSRKF